MNHTTDEMGERWLSTSEAAAQLGVSDKTVRRRIRRGELEARKVPSDSGGFVWEIATDANGCPLESAPIERTLDSPSDSPPAQPTGHPSDSPIAQADTQAMGHFDGTSGQPIAQWPTKGGANPLSHAQSDGTSDSPLGQGERTSEHPSGHPTDSPMAQASGQPVAQPGEEREGHRSDARAELLDHLKEENRFLRAQLEAAMQSEAQTKAALREALKAMPKALPAVSTDGARPQINPQSTPQSSPTEATRPAPETPQSSGSAPPKEPRPLWKVMLGIR